MASKIKGITIEIGGDTTKLGKALDGVNKQARSLQSELKTVEKGLKLDPSNVELIKEKQSILNETIEATKEKLTTLKGTQEQVQSQFDKGEITSSQYREFQREILNTQNQLNSLTNEAKKFGSNTSASLISASVKVEEFGNKTVEVGKKLSVVSAGMSAATVAVGKSAIDSMNSVDEGLDTVMKKTGATGETAKELQQVYNEVASEVPANFGDIGSAVGEINTRLDFTGDKLKQASIDFLKFAEVNDADVNTSVQLVTRAMGDAGIEANSYKSVLEMLTVAGQKSGISIDTLSTNLAKYGAPMRALGIDTKNAIAMFAGWEKAGVNTEIAFSGMKKAISNWGAEGKDAAQEFQTTLDKIKAAPDIATATSMAIDVFGAKAGPDLADAIQGGRFAFEDYINALNSAGGSVDSTYGMIIDEVDDAQLAHQNYQLTLHDLGELISKTIGPILLNLSLKFKELVEKFSKLDGTTKTIIVSILGLVAAIGPILIVIGKIATGVSAVIKVINLLKSATLLATAATKAQVIAQTALNTVMNMNPIGFVIISITALIGLFAVLWNKCEWFREGWSLTWEAVKKFCKDACDNVVKFFNGIINFFKKNWQNLLSFILNPIAGAFKLAYDNCEWFRNIVDNLVQNIKNFFINLKDNIVSTFSNVGTFFGNIFTIAVTNIKNAFLSIPQFFVNIWNSIVNLFSNIGTSVGSAIGNGFRNVVNSVIGWAEKTINGFLKSINNAIGFINNIPGVTIKKFNMLELPRMRTGGTVVGDGQSIFAEGGSPELLTLSNGKAYVRPLTSRDKSQVLDNKSGNHNYNVTINNNSKYTSPADTARRTRRELQKLRLKEGW